MTNEKLRKLLQEAGAKTAKAKIGQKTVLHGGVFLVEVPEGYKAIFTLEKVENEPEDTPSSN